MSEKINPSIPTSPQEQFVPEHGRDWRLAVSEQQKLLVEKMLKLGSGIARIMGEGDYKGAGQRGGYGIISFGAFASSNKDEYAHSRLKDFGVDPIIARDNMVIHLAPRYNARGFPLEFADEVTTRRVRKEWGSKVIKEHDNMEIISFQRLPKKFSDYLGGQISEPAVAMIYNVHSGQQPSTRWSGADSRMSGGDVFGGYIFVSILPESAVQEFASALQENPALIRIFAEQAFRSSPEVVKASTWEEIPGANGIRPPYERLDAAPGGGRIYVQPLDGPPGWHEEFNRPVRFANE